MSTLKENIEKVVHESKIHSIDPGMMIQGLSDIKLGDTKPTEGERVLAASFADFILIKMNEKPENKIATMMMIMRVYESLIKKVVVESVVNAIPDLPNSEAVMTSNFEKADELNKLVAELKFKYDEVYKDLTNLESLLKEKASNQSIEQYVAYLLYAANKYASPAEKTSINKIIIKIRNEGQNTSVGGKHNSKVSS